MTGRDWTKERWRKQYIREPLQHRGKPLTGSVMAQIAARHTLGERCPSAPQRPSN